MATNFKKYCMAVPLVADDDSIADYWLEIWFDDEESDPKSVHGFS
jgi:hypothetical protein